MPIIDCQSTQKQNHKHKSSALMDVIEENNSIRLNTNTTKLMR